MGTTPTGTVTFLFTDIEGSTELAQQYPDSITALLDRHHGILTAAIESRNGYIFQIVGDAFCAAFQTVGEALDAALEAQRCLQAEPWSPATIRVRMGISTGTAWLRPQPDRPSDYAGYLSLVRVQRVMSLAHGGQVLLANASSDLVRMELPPGVSLRDKGEHRLKGLLNPEHLWQVIAPGLQWDFPALVSLNAIPNNLPLQLTSFVGREFELDRVRQLLERHRLVTLTGAGGAGKTRMSLQVAAEVLDRFRDGVWLVELAPIGDPALITQVVLSVLGLPGGQGREPLEVLKDFMTDKSLLLILDNCEHLLDAACRFAQAILQAGPNVKILSTSREALNLGGEQAYRVPSLSAPDLHDLPPPEQLVQSEAVQLFIERATLVSPGFAVTDGNAPIIAQICDHLDGIPLAIELAAARVSSMPLDALAGRLDDRFRLLTGGSRTALPRHQTLRATLDWSYNLLADPVRLLLQRLSVFQGGWRLEAAEAVCAGDGIEQAEVLDLMSKLADKSMLWLDEHERYHMLETVRQYARGKLLESEQADRVRSRHLEYMLQLAEQAEPEIRGPDQLVWLDRLYAELDNLRAALSWAQERDSGLLLRLASALWRFWDLRVTSHEARNWVTKALLLTATSPTAARARAQERLAFQYANELNSNLAEQYARQALDLSTSLADRQCMAMALTTLGWSIRYQDPPAAAALCNQGLALAREMGDHWLAASALHALARVASDRNDTASSCRFYRQALQESRLSGDRRFIAVACGDLADVVLAQGNAAWARELMEEALSIFTELGDRANVVYAHVTLALAAVFRQDYPAAEASIAAAYETAKATHWAKIIAYALLNYGILDWAAGNASQFCEREQAALAMAQQANHPSLVARALCRLGEGFLLKADTEGARDSFTRALALSQENHFRSCYCYCLQGLGCLALSRRETARAVRLFAARASVRETALAEDFFPFMVREREQLIAEARTRLGSEAFDLAWAAGQAMTEEEALTYAMEDGARS